MTASAALRAGTTAADAYALDVVPESAGWGYCGLRILELCRRAERRPSPPATRSTLVLSLSGSRRVTVDGETFDLEGRSRRVRRRRPTSCTCPATPSSSIAQRAAEAASPCRRRAATNRLAVPATCPADAVPVELRGAGQASRQVNNFGTPGVLDADQLIACEVLTPGGNWSSYPPHKHDEDRDGESALEEIYYFEVATARTGRARLPAGLRPRRTPSIDVLAEVRTGDVVLIPHGWHGPSMAAPGYDLYYLNVMAGPGDERAWLICDDPAHAWVRDTWADAATSTPRLPVAGQRQGSRASGR